MEFPHLLPRRAALDRITTGNVRKYFCHCNRYLHACRLGLNIQQAAYAFKKYMSHHRIPVTVLDNPEIVLRGDVAVSNPTQNGN
ncbi:unnamed protein product [Mycena citricolor]|uniref:Uncharacterized protein n=1 Tax=Mycena citricolor TaxID=2018698 RepID=A0AAD2HZA2_9AGAR|nr:unnamed protein product [Mycena citricolor]